jgi:hypothetical protein
MSLRTPFPPAHAWACPWAPTRSRHCHGPVTHGFSAAPRCQHARLGRARPRACTRAPKPAQCCMPCALPASTPASSPRVRARCARLRTPGSRGPPGSYEPQPRTVGGAFMNGTQRSCRYVKLLAEQARAESGEFGLAGGGGGRDPVGQCQQHGRTRRRFAPMSDSADSAISSVNAFCS